MSKLRDAVAAEKKRTAKPTAAASADVSITAPMLTTEPKGHCPGAIEVKLRGKHRDTYARIHQGLRMNLATLDSGHAVERAPSVLLWLLEQFAAAMPTTED